MVFAIAGQSQLVWNEEEYLVVILVKKMKILQFMISTGIDWFMTKMLKRVFLLTYYRINHCLTSGLLPVHREGKLAKFTMHSWRTLLALTSWTIFPVGMFAFEMWTMVKKMIIYDGGDGNKWNFFIVLFSFVKFVVICTAPFLRVNIIVDGKVDLVSKWSSGKILLLFGLLVDTIGSLWQAIETPVSYYQNLYLLILVIPAVIIQKIQIACGIIVFCTAVSWLTTEGEETDILSMKEYILSSRKLIQRFNNIQQGSGIFLFVMCFYCAMMSVFYAWVGIAMFKFSAVSSIPFFHVALGNILILKVIITSAHDAHESLSKQKALLR